MLKVIGAGSIEELFADIPAKLRMPRPVDDDGISEYEAMRLLESIAEQNTFPLLDSYLGAGAYEHHVPAIVGAICSKSEFLTSYTPYQAEASQGMLQIIFEYQSAICALTGMDVSNASLYDGASACAESVLMALRLQNEKNKIFVSKTLNPRYRAVVEQYLASHQVKVETIPYRPDGSLDADYLAEKIDKETAAVLVQSPNFLGVVEDLKPIGKKIKESGALFIICANPLSYGLYANARELGADIAVGDSQPFGLPLQFGGPYVGYLACRQEYVRQMPGRLAGETVDTDGRRGFVLTLQAREQHIRREKATSNICTNQALAALASLIGMLWYGNQGIHKLALTNYQRTAYLRDKLKLIPGVKLLGTHAFLNEFAVSFGKPAAQVQEGFRSHGIEPGVPLGRYYSELMEYFLVSVTETKNQAQLDKYVQVASGK